MSQDLKCFFDIDELYCKLGMLGLDVVVILIVVYLIYRANIKIEKIKSPSFWCTNDTIFDETYSIFSLWLVYITKFMLCVLIILRFFDLYLVFTPAIHNALITNLFLVFSYASQTLGDIIYILQLAEWIVMIVII